MRWCRRVTAVLGCVLLSAFPARAEPLDLTPLYLDGDALEVGYRAYKHGETAVAVGLLREYLRDAPPGQKRDGASFLLALLLGDLAKAASATEAEALRLDRLVALTTLRGVRAYAAVVEPEIGQDAEARGDLANAIERYSRVPAGSARHLESRLSAARLLLRSNKPQEAVALCDATEAQGVTDFGRARLRRLRAEALDKSGQRAEAIWELHEIWRDQFGTRGGDEAFAALKRLGSAPGTTESFVMSVGRLEKGSRGQLEASVRAAKAKWPKAGKAAYSLANGIVEDIAGSEPKALTELQRAAKTGSPFVRGHALLRMARLEAQLKNPAAALRHALDLVDSIPDHPVAGSALAFAVDLARRLGDRPQAEALLDRLGRQYSGRSREPGADWHIAWAAWQAGRFEPAARLFRRIASQHRRERHLGGASWGERGTYWEARSLERAGQPERAVDLYAALVRESPLSYYSSMAFARLHALDRTRAVDLRPHRKLTQYDPPALADVTALGLDSTPDVIHAAALVRLGLFEMALADLKARQAANTLGSDGVTLLLSLMVRTAKTDPTRALRRWYGALPRYPDDADERLWRHVYPLAWWSTVEARATADTVSPWLVMALIRHESRYRPDIVSKARAVGLMQLLESTARYVAKGLGEVVPKSPSFKDLKDPAVNIPLGVRFVRDLARQFHGNEALVLAAYNAGPGRTKRLLLEALASGLTHTDEFIETIPYRETHSYVKSVLASFGVYRYVYGDRDDPAMRGLPTPALLPAEFSGL